MAAEGTNRCAVSSLSLSFYFLAGNLNSENILVLTSDDKSELASPLDGGGSLVTL